MKGKDSKKILTKEQQTDPKMVNNLAPEPAKNQCPECGQEVPGGVDQDEQKSGKFDDVKEPSKEKSHMRHGQY